MFGTHLTESDGDLGAIPLALNVDHDAFSEGGVLDIVADSQRETQRR
jgi:hypothetical protein